MFWQKISAIGLLLAGIFLLSGVLLREARGADSAQSAPVNPEFIKWKKEAREGKRSRGGVVPDPVDRSHLEKARYESFDQTAPPEGKRSRGGVVPDPADRSHLEKARYGSFDQTVPPEGKRSRGGVVPDPVNRSHLEKARYGSFDKRTEPKGEK
ncbi:MAG: hypothetical protein LBC93_04000 [Synergistaceae bacterium]|jgi:hypothetical protein|nr:hypothetical protein [Synergistaceae bacterium]